MCVYVYVRYISGQSTIIDHRNRVCDRQKSSLNSRHDHQYPDVRITFNNLNSFITFSKTILSYFEKANKICNKNIAPAIRNIEMVSKDLTS